MEHGLGKCLVWLLKTSHPKSTTHFSNKITLYETIIGLNGLVCKQYQWLVLAWTQKSLMSFFFTISDEANAANEAVAEEDICQLCNGLKETTNDGSRFGFCKQRSLGRPRLLQQASYWQTRRPKVRPLNLMGCPFSTPLINRNCLCNQGYFLSISSSWQAWYFVLQLFKGCNFQRVVSTVHIDGFLAIWCI